MVLFGESEVSNGHLNTAAIEDAHDCALAVHRRQEADPKVKVIPLDRHLNAAVLRTTLLRDVDVPHDLEAGRQRREEPAGRAVAFDQDAVDPIPDADAV